LEPPSNLPVITRTAELKNDLTAIGKTNFRGKNQNFGIKADDRRRHLYIVGKTGMGKSTLLENMIFSDITSGKGVAVIDPHGDLAEAVIDFVPASRTNDVIIFDPADSEFPVSFNMLEAQNPANRHLVASGIVGVFKKIFADSWGPRLEHILRNTLLALVEAPNTSMLGVMRMLVDNKYRSQVLNSVKDPMVLNFWNQEFGAWNPKQVAEAISPIQNKVGQFLSSPLVRNILGQTKSTIDLRFAMDKRKIIIVNLSKGKIGEDNSALLGSMLVTKFQLDVMSRADIGESEREDFYLYVDEFQNFATDSFATILSEARKYKLNLTVANQYLAQMPDTVREAVFGNVGSLLSFQVGFDDAEDIANQLGGEAQMITAQDLATLPKYQIYLRQMIDGMPSKTFSANTLPPPEFEAEGGRREKLIKVSRERYSKERGLVEEKIIKWANN
jgi:type IV secretory pathway TraG/TraD family ATPase VirD4